MELSLLLGGIDLTRTRHKSWFRKRYKKLRSVRKSYRRDCLVVSYPFSSSNSFLPFKVQDSELVTSSGKASGGAIRKLTALCPLIGIGSSSQRVRSGYWKRDCVWSASRSPDPAAEDFPTRTGAVGLETTVSSAEVEAESERDGESCPSNRPKDILAVRNCRLACRASKRSLPALLNNVCAGTTVKKTV